MLKLLAFNHINNMQQIIENAFDDISTLTIKNAPKELINAVNDAINLLDSGKERIAIQHSIGNWSINQWLKKAVLLYFRLNDNHKITTNGWANFYDKVPTKFCSMSDSEIQAQGIRIVPPAVARKGSFIDKGAILMPSYVNIGAYIGCDTMVDTWATVGSCAQIGKNVHLSGGVGIGGVLEPLQASPTIIEDNCFIGARSEVVEGVIVEEGSVISMGVYIGQSTKIYNRATGSITYGRVPAGSVVVSGNLPAKDGSHSLYCAVIVKQVDSKTLAKVGINELLRDI